MAEDLSTNEELTPLPFIEDVARPEEAGTHPTSTSNMPPMKEVPAELHAVAAKVAAPRSAEALAAKPPSIKLPKSLPKADQDPGIWNFGRRSFLQASGWLSFFGFITLATVGALRMMFPRILYEPPTTFKAGTPKDYLPMAVNEKYKESERVWICRDEDKIFALIAICTHLGCTPRWLTSEFKFKCPCHGSGYTFEGINFEGPAPRPLERAKIQLSPDGELLVDKGISFRYERGDWVRPESFVPV
jgi:cytochrome b6-f complex iron-sulfur subunit